MTPDSQDVRERIPSPPLPLFWKGDFGVLIAEVSGGNSVAWHRLSSRRGYLRMKWCFLKTPFEIVVVKVDLRLRRTWAPVPLEALPCCSDDQHVVVFLRNDLYHIPTCVYCSAGDGMEYLARSHLTLRNVQF